MLIEMHLSHLLLVLFLPIVYSNPFSKVQREKSPADFYLTAQGASSIAQPISKDVAGLSIEFCYTKDYLGDVKNPNQLSLDLLQNIQDIGGSPPVIRLGGHTQDVASFCESCPETLNNTFAAGNDEAIGVNFNKHLLTVLNENVPSRQKFLFGLNFGSNNVSIPIAEVKAVEKYINPSRLLSYELGNEPDFYHAQRPEGWNLGIFVAQQIQWFKELSPLIKKGFSLGSLAQQPRYMGNFSLQGMNSLEMYKKVDYPVAYSDHTYFYSLCDPISAQLVSLRNLMNHTATVQYLEQWKPEIQAAKDASVPFIMGETGSVSCHGAYNVSNTLGAALWELDYILHGSILGMRQFLFHMGTRFFYSAWQPVEWNGSPARVYPTYYVYLFMAHALSLSDPHVVSLNEGHSDIAFYGIYSRAPTANSKPDKVIILNLAYLPANSTSIPEPSRSVDVSGIFDGKVKVTRLSGPGSDSISDATLAGQSFDSGKAQGKQLVEIADSEVTLRSSEAVIVEGY